MRIADLNWIAITAQIANNDRCVEPIGSTEQHAQLSLCGDANLAKQVALAVSESVGSPVFPVMPYGLAFCFKAYTRTINRRVKTQVAVMRDVIASLDRSGFRHNMIVNGHVGNALSASMADSPERRLRPGSR